MSVHESCLLVCLPCFNIMKLWTFDPNLHLSFAGTTFCLLSCLFAFLLVYMLSCFFTCHVYHAYLLYAFFICSLYLFLQLLVCWFLVFAFTCTHMEWGCMELGHGLLGASKKHEHVDISQTAVFSRFRGLASPIWLCTLLNSLPFSLRWVVLGISCHVPFILISRVWRPPFTFLHLYFGSCSRDVGIYFPALCACIVHDVCIYIPAHPFRCDCHNPCHLRQSDAKFPAKVRWLVTGFSLWKSSILPECLRKA